MPVPCVPLAEQVADASVTADVPLIVCVPLAALVAGPVVAAAVPECV